MRKKIVVLIPCYNEAETIGKVVCDFKKQLPKAEIYVYDNNSTDNTIEVAQKSGAIIGREKKQGKSAVVKKMFQDIEADIFVIVDGDDTYYANDVHKLVSEIKKGADMVVGDRISGGYYSHENKRLFHNFGNRLVRFIINKLFHVQLGDIMSGYRAFSHRFVKNYPVLCDGFQIETDMTIFALDHQFTIEEISIKYKDRPTGSNSKLRTIPDGIKVIAVIFNLYRYYKPLKFFGIISGIFFIGGMAVGVPVILEYLKYNYIYKVPSAILASGLILLSFIFVSIAIILDSVRRISKEHFEIFRKR